MDKKSRVPNFEGVAMVTKHCVENGLWLPIVPLTKLDDPLERRFMDMSGSHVLRFMPPITVTTDQIDEVVDIIEGGLKIAEKETAGMAKTA